MATPHGGTAPRSGSPGRATEPLSLTTDGATPSIRCDYVAPDAAWLARRLPSLVPAYCPLRLEVWSSAPPIHVQWPVLGDRAGATAGSGISIGDPGESGLTRSSLNLLPGSSMAPCLMPWPKDRPDDRKLLGVKSAMVLYSISP